MGGRRGGDLDCGWLKRRQENSGEWGEEEERACRGGEKGTE